MTKVIHKAGDCHIRISGHAGAGVKGNDLVCAAVSALSWTLLSSVIEYPEYNVQYSIDPEEGVMDIRCDPEEEAKDICRYLFGIIAGGLSLLADKYPEYVQFEGR